MKYIWGILTLMIFGVAVWGAFNLHGFWSIFLWFIAYGLSIPPIALFFNNRVAGNVAGTIAVGVLLAGSIIMADSHIMIIKILGFIFAYLLWLGFSAILIGTPIIILPIPPFFIFSWQKLTSIQKKEMWLRLYSLAIIGFVILIVSKL